MKGKEKQRAEDEERNGLLEIPFDPGQCFDGHIGELGEPQRRDLQDEVGAFTRDDTGGQVSTRNRMAGSCRSRSGVESGKSGKHAKDHSQLGGARDPEGQKEGDDGPVFLRLEDPGGQGGHGVTAKSQDHGQNGLAVEAHPLEDLVGHHRQPGQVPRILHEPEDEEETAHNGQYDGNGVSQGHGEKPIRTDEKVVKKEDGTKAGSNG